MSSVAPYALAPFTGGSSLIGKAMGGVGGLFGNALRTPDPPAAPPAPQVAIAPVQQVASETAQRRSRARGYRSTILSQMMPDSSPALKNTFGT